MSSCEVRCRVDVELPREEPIGCDARPARAAAANVAVHNSVSRVRSASGVMAACRVSM